MKENILLQPFSEDKQKQLNKKIPAQCYNMMSEISCFDDITNLVSLRNSLKVYWIESSHWLSIKRSKLFNSLKCGKKLKGFIRTANANNIDVGNICEICMYERIEFECFFGQARDSRQKAGFVVLIN